MSTAARVIEQIRTIVVTDRDRRTGDVVPPPGALRLGRRAHEFLSVAAGWRSSHGHPLTALFGVPIDPDGEGCSWALLDHAGAVIAEGVINEP